MSKIQKRSARVKLPGQPVEHVDRPPVEPETVYRAICASILRDPVSTPSEKLRAVEGLMRYTTPTPTTVEQLARDEVAGLSDEQLDELLGYLTHPLGQREPREVERELAAQTAKLEREFQERVDARVHELVDVEAVEAQIERRAREIAAQGRPLAEAPVAPREETSQPEPLPTVAQLADWPPDRHRPR